MEVMQKNIAANLLWGWIASTAFLFGSPTNAQIVTVELLEHSAPKSVTFGPSSDLMLSGSDGYFQMWSRHDQRFVGPRMLVNSLYAKDPNSIALKGGLRFSKDGRFMASCRYFTDRSLTESKPILAQVWDIRTGETVAELERDAFKTECKALDFSPDGSMLAVANGGFGDINSVRFFETRNWTELRRAELGGGALLLDKLRYSPDGQQLAVWASNPLLPPGISSKDYKEAIKRIGLDRSLFRDHRIEAIVLNAIDGQVLARKVLHWFPNASFSIDSWEAGGFDASGERILSTVPHGGILEQQAEAIYTNCTNFRPSTIPDGFLPEELCKNHKSVQVWHWKNGRVDTLFEYPIYVRSPHFSPGAPETWATIRDAQFTSDGRYLVWIKTVEEKKDLLRTEVSPISPSISTLEIRDAQTYQLLLSKEVAPKEKRVGRLSVSPDGRFLAWRESINKRYSADFIRRIYEILSK